MVSTKAELQFPFFFFFFAEIAQNRTIAETHRATQHNTTQTGTGRNRTRHARHPHSRLVGAISGSSTTEQRGGQHMSKQANVKFKFPIPRTGLIWQYPSKIQRGPLPKAKPYFAWSWITLEPVSCVDPATKKGAHMAWLSLLCSAMRSFCAHYQTSDGQHTGTSCRDHHISSTQRDKHTHGCATLFLDHAVGW